MQLLYLTITSCSDFSRIRTNELTYFRFQMQTTSRTYCLELSLSLSDILNPTDTVKTSWKQSCCRQSHFGEESGNMLIMIAALAQKQRPDGTAWLKSCLAERLFRDVRRQCFWHLHMPWLCYQQEASTFFGRCDCELQPISNKAFFHADMTEGRVHTAFLCMFVVNAYLETFHNMVLASFSMAFQVCFSFFYIKPVTLAAPIKATGQCCLPGPTSW